MSWLSRILMIHCLSHADPIMVSWQWCIYKRLITWESVGTHVKCMWQIWNCFTRLLCPPSPVSDILELLHSPPRNSCTNNRKVWHKHLFSERVDSQKTSFAHRWLILLAAPNPERLIHTYTICSLILFDKSIVCLWIFIHQFFYFIHSIFFCRLHEKYLDNLFNSKLKIPICWRVNIHKRIAAQLWMTKKPQPITLAALIYKALSFLASSSIKCNQSWN